MEWLFHLSETLPDIIKELIKQVKKIEFWKEPHTREDSTSHEEFIPHEYLDSEKDLGRILVFRIL